MNDDEDFLPGGFGELLRQAQELQEQLLAAQGELADVVVEGQSGGGVVRITVTGGLQFRSVSIDPEAVDPDDIGMLEDLVLAAIHDAVDQARRLSPGGLVGGPPGLGGGLGAGLGGFDILGGGAGGLGLIEELFDQLMGGPPELDEGDYEEDGGEDEEDGGEDEDDGPIGGGPP